MAPTSMSLQNGVKHDLRLAGRMSRLGTKTAFEVLVRARALEAKGQDVVHLEIGEPDFDTPGNIVEAAVDALHGGLDALRPLGWLASAASSHRRGGRASREACTVHENEVVVIPGGKPILFFSVMALCRGWR